MNIVQDKCPTCGRKRTRSLPQNNRLHKLFTEMAANLKAQDGLYHPMPWWKVMCKDRWLGYNEYKSNDKTIYELKSTAELTVDELNDFMNSVERYANQRGIYLDDVYGA